MEQITLDRIQRKIERLKWDNYLREFQDKRSQILDTYWHCVATDLLSNDIVNSQNAYEKFYWLFFSSFSSCFYFSVDLLQKVLEAYDGYSYYHRHEEEETEWNELQDKLRRKIRRHLTTLAKSVRSNYKNDEGITARKKMVMENLGAFDHFHETAGLPISIFIVQHLKDAVRERDLVIPINELRGCKFEFFVEHSLAESLQEIGHDYLKAAMKFIAMVKVTSELEGHTTRYQAYPRLTPKQAVEDSHQRYPHLKHRPFKEKARYIRTCYRNPEGDRLELDSIKKCLKRIKTYPNK